MSDPILITKDLKKNYEDVQAVRGISFRIEPGEIYSLLGPNGAGKTTTIGMLTGLLKPTDGDAFVDGHSVVRETKAVKKIIGVVPQEIALYDDLTGRENLAFWGRMCGLSGKELSRRIEDMLDLADLNDHAGRKVSTYSGGMQRRLNIAAGLIHHPKILFMDEPTVGIDPQSRRRILDTVMELNRQGLTVLYTTHYMEEAQELSDRIGIIDNGQLIANGSLDELIRMVGTHEILRFRFETPLVNSQKLVASVQSQPGVYHVVAEEDQLIMQVDSANDALPVFLPRLGTMGHRVTAVEIKEPNLEAVFLHLTGRALRDE